MQYIHCFLFVLFLLVCGGTIRRDRIKDEIGNDELDY